MAKNIVLLSDGTGNSAGKANGTNVWRMYLAVDQRNNDQVAFYDDGVGTSVFKPLKMLGGAFGWGLKANVIDLYVSVCQTWKAGDRIFLFGFSRGAYTVRCLSAMITEIGIVTGVSDPGTLKRLAEQMYEEDRKCFEAKGTRMVRLVGSTCRAIRRLFRTDIPLPPTATIEKPDIAFVGVWDTVDAVGFPIDELADAWDAIIFKFRFPDYDLSPKVEKACHALALDDERHTFHPVLWNESSMAHPGQIEQVWFAGAHSNVGGGYPEDDLSLVSLDWMMGKAEAAGLRLMPLSRAEAHNQAKRHGKLYDSRSGVAAYYRYMPRDLAALCDDKSNGVTITVPRIHESVLRRIRDGVVPYAPIGLPATYELEPEDTNATGPLPQRVYEDPAKAAQRASPMSYVGNLVYWRRWLFRALLTATAGLVASRFFLDWSPGAPCRGGPECMADAPLRFLAALIPDLAAGWLEALRQNPGWLAVFAAAFLVLSILKWRAFYRTQFWAGAMWAHVRDRNAAPPNWKPTPTFRLRSGTDRARAQRRYRYLAQWAVALAIVCMVLYAANKGLYELRASVGALCTPRQATNELPTGTTVLPTFSVSEPCFATGWKLKRGWRYTFSVEATDENGRRGTPYAEYPWRDGGIPAGPDGFRDPDVGGRPVFLLATPMRRSWVDPWFTLMGWVGPGGADRFTVGRGPTTVTAVADGELFLFVNDAVLGILPGSGWSWFYRSKVGKNRGTAKLTVESLAPLP